MNVQAPMTNAEAQRWVIEIWSFIGHSDLVISSFPLPAVLMHAHARCLRAVVGARAAAIEFAVAHDAFAGADQAIAAGTGTFDRLRRRHVLSIFPSIWAGSTGL